MRKVMIVVILVLMFGGLCACAVSMETMETGRSEDRDISEERNASRPSAGEVQSMTMYYNNEHFIYKRKPE
ncbi:MAG: hypothetical protein IJG85_08600 [Eubacteriaceae bacterium]|nr:hypothetical protein [Eubacteriaceae bacterium]